MKINVVDLKFKNLVNIINEIYENNKPYPNSIITIDNEIELKWDNAYPIITVSLRNDGSVNLNKEYNAGRISCEDFTQQRFTIFMHRLETSI